MPVIIESIEISVENEIKQKGSVLHAVNAGEKCIRNSKYKAGEIELLINTGIFRDKHIAEPAMSSFIQKELKINSNINSNRTFSFDLTNGTAGMLNAIYILESLIKNKIIKCGMIVSSDFNTDKIKDPDYKYCKNGTAMIIDNSINSDKGFKKFIFKTYEKYNNYSNSFIDLSVKSGQLKVINKPGWEEKYIDCSADTIIEYIQNNNIKLANIDYIISSESSEKFINSLSKKIKFSISKIISTSNFTNNIFHSTSLFTAFKLAKQQNIIKSNKNILFLSVGSGITTGCTLYKT